MDQGKRSHAFHRMKRVGQECLKFPRFSLEPHQPQQYWQGGLTSWQCRKNCESRRKRKEKRINYSKFRRAESEKKTPPHGRNQVKRVIVTPAVYPRLIEFLHFDIQSTGQKSHCVITDHRPSQCFVLIIQSDSLCPCQF
ncbi:hypothetical protein T01_1363 [Trichinella spiralis]|uniref:Uncharacterized protein n=1 Tax=Trichinella spiralis TaxID=6334 RepID=A0A0V1APJ2_TRISP|nr:hypothetical protein T01_1363 [Trichinella spiralis]